MSEIKYGNFKIVCFTCKCTSKRLETNCYKRFSYKVSLCIRLDKNDSVNGMPENVASMRILTKMAASVFHRI